MHLALDRDYLNLISDNIFEYFNCPTWNCSQLRIKYCLVIYIYIYIVVQVFFYFEYMQVCVCVCVCLLKNLRPKLELSHSGLQRNRNKEY